MPKALISGGNGFLASHLTKALEGSGVEVVTIHRSVFNDFKKLKELFEEEQPEYIFHFAAYGNHGIQTEHEEIIKANLVGTYKMLQASLNVPYKAFINIGSSSEYGKKTEPMKESDLPEGDTFYAATKVGATYLAKAYSRQFDKPIVTIRPFSVFGPGEADFRFIPTAIKHMLEGTEMPFVGSPTHDWIYVDDFIDAVAVVASQAQDLQGRVVNVGTGEARSNRDVITDLSYVADKGIKTKEGGWIEQPHHSSLWVADNSLLKSLGWRQNYTFSEGLSKTYEYYKAKYTN